MQIATLCKCLVSDTKKSKAKSHRLSEGSYMSSLPINNVGACMQLCSMSLGVCAYTSASVYIYVCLCLQVNICICLIIAL